MLRKNTRQRRTGIALREVVVVILCLGFFLLMASMWLLRQQAKSRRTLCDSRQMVTARAMIQYDKIQLRLTPYRLEIGEESQQGDNQYSWVVAMLPYFSHVVPQDKEKPPEEQTFLYPYRESYEKYGPEGKNNAGNRLPVFTIPEIICPADERVSRQQKQAWMSLVVNTGMPDAAPNKTFPTDWPANGVFFDGLAKPHSLHKPMTLEYITSHDGRTHTLLLSENIDSGQWTDTDEASLGFVWVSGTEDGQPNPGKKLWRLNKHHGKKDGTIRFASPSSNHVGGVNAAFCDGKTQFINDDIDYIVYCQMMTPDNTKPTYPGSDKLVETPYRLEIKVVK